MIARANIANIAVRMDSHAEEWWDTYGTLLLADQLEQAVVLTQYHPLTFHIAGGSYTPDFLHILVDGGLIFVEVKGSTQQRNYRDARSKLRAAADMFRWATFYEVIVSSGSCEKIEAIAP